MKKSAWKGLEHNTFRVDILATDIVAGYVSGAAPVGFGIPD